MDDLTKLRRFKIIKEWGEKLFDKVSLDGDRVCFNTVFHNREITLHNDINEILPYSDDHYNRCASLTGSVEDTVKSYVLQCWQRLGNHFLENY